MQRGSVASAWRAKAALPGSRCFGFGRVPVCLNCPAAQPILAVALTGTLHYKSIKHVRRLRMAEDCSRTCHSACANEVDHAASTGGCRDGESGCACSSLMTGADAAEVLHQADLRDN